MGRKWKTAAILILVLIGILYLSLNSRWVQEPAKRAILATLSRHIPGTIEAERIGLQFVPPALNFYGLKYSHSKEDPEPNLVVPKVTATFSPWSLLTEVTIIKEIRLVQPRIRWEPPAESPAGPAEPDRSAGPLRSIPIERPSVVVVRKVQMSDGTVDVFIPARQAHLDAPAVNGTVLPDLDMRQFHIQLDSGAATVELPGVTKQVERVTAELVASRDRIELKTAQITGTDSAVKMAGHIQDLTEMDYSVRIEGSVPLSDLQSLLAFKADLKGNVQARVDLAGSKHRPLSAEGNVRLDRGSVNGIALADTQGDFEFTNREIQVENFSTSVFGGDVRGRGRVDFGASPPGFDFSVEAKNIVLDPLAELGGRPGLLAHQILTGTMAVKGRGSDPKTLSGKGSFSVRNPSPPDPPDDGRADWIGWTDHLRNSSARFTVAGGKWVVENGTAQSALSELHFSGALNPDRTLDVLFHVDSREVHDFSPLLKLPFVRGSARVDGTIKGPLEKPQITAEGTLSAATIKGRHFDSVSGSVVYEHPRLSFSDASVRNGRASYQLNGVLSFDSTLPDRPGFDIEARISDGAPREIVALFWKELPLSITASGSLRASGNPEMFQVASGLTVGPGSIYGQPIESGRLDLEVTRHDITFRNVEAQTGHSTVNGSGRIGFNGLFEVDADTSEVHATDVQWVADHLPGITSWMSGTLKGGGELENPEFNLDTQVQEFEYGDQPYGSGTLSIRVADKKLLMIASLDNGVSARATLELNPPLPYELSVSLNRFEAGAILKRTAYFKGDWISTASAVVSGRLSGQGTLKDLKESDLELLLTAVQVKAGEFSLANDRDLDVVMRNGAVEFKAFSLSAENLRTSVSGTLRPGESFNLLITTEGDLDLLRNFTEEVTIARGTVQASMQLQDRWDDPVIRGQISMKEGRIRSRTLDQFILIDGIDLTFNRHQVLLDSFEGRIGGGRMTANGKWRIEGFKTEEAGVNLELESVRFTAIPGLNAVLDASLLYKEDAEGRSLNGEVLVQRASYDRRIDWQRALLDMIKGNRSSKASPAVEEEIRLNIQVLGKDNIRVNNNIAEIPLNIDLVVRGTSKHPVLLGRMEARGGLIRFRQNEFKIQSGSVDFIDTDRIRPILDLSATTRVRGYRIVLTMVGPVDRIDLTLTSDPILTSQEILALLTFGTTPEEMDQSQMEALAGGEAIDLLTGDIQVAVEEKAKQFGIDRLQVDPLFSSTKNPGAPRVTVSKRLWEDTFYVTYITTFDASGEDIIQMEYIISDNVSLVGGRDELGLVGGDLKFRFEFR